MRNAGVEAGLEPATAVLMAANAAIDRQERDEAMHELGERVEDWKGHRLESFGDLLLHGTFPVIKGDSTNPKDQEREVSSLCHFNLVISAHANEVQDLPVRAYSTMLQGNESQQAEEQNDGSTSD